MAQRILQLGSILAGSSLLLALGWTALSPFSGYIPSVNAQEVNAQEVNAQEVNAQETAPSPASPPLTFATDGVAILGTDPVAYFTLGTATAGDPAFAHDWNGVTWHFANAEHRDLFAADPDRYAPQYGGFCAYAVSRGYTADIDPNAWRIVEDKLYLNLSPRVQSLWERDIPGNISRADQNWPSLSR
ncbi:MAG: YHS domain-containing protein [Synechococcaceae cyanobacterium SM2_3_2]|nr:YHS domain-containing protein [Synechococcaceae cyanobacterium SM2_3_2]